MNSKGTLGVQGIEDKRNLPSGGVSSDAPSRVYFVRTVSLVPKYTLQVASELTPEGRLRFSSIPCTPRVPWEFTGLGHFDPKWPKSAQKF